VNVFHVRAADELGLGHFLTPPAEHGALVKMRAVAIQLVPSPIPRDKEDGGNLWKFPPPFREDELDRPPPLSINGMIEDSHGVRSQN